MKAARLMVIVATLLAVAVSGGSSRAQSGSAWKSFPIDGRLVSEQELVKKNAPVFVQWLAKDWDQLDRFWPLDFNIRTPQLLDQWKATGRWQDSNRPKPSGPPVVYGGLFAATRKQAFLAYYFYHPRDYSTFSPRKLLVYPISFVVNAPLKHENDLEGGVLVVGLDGSPHTHAFALAHNRWSERDGTGNGTKGFDRCETAILVEAGKHGAHLWRDLKTLRSQPTTFHSFGGGWVTSDRAVLYTPTGSECPTNNTELETATYELRPLDAFYAADAFAAKAHSFFAKKSTILVKGGHPATELTRVDVFKAIGGRDGPRAHWPWGQLTGDFDFYDPVSWVLGKLADHKCEIDPDYKAMPYLDRHVAEPGRERVRQGLAARARELRKPCPEPSGFAHPPGPADPPTPHGPPPVAQPSLDVDLDPFVTMQAPATLTLLPRVTVRVLDPSEVTLTWKTVYSSSWSGLQGEQTSPQLMAAFGPGTHGITVTARARNFTVSSNTTVDVGDFPAISFAFGNDDPQDSRERSAAGINAARQLGADVVTRNRETIRVIRQMMTNDRNLDVTLYARSDRWGDESVNLPLRRRRANAVRALITADSGIDPTRVRIEAETRDRVCADDNDGCDALNRHVRVTAFLAGNTKATQN